MAAKKKIAKPVVPAIATPEIDPGLASNSAEIDEMAKNKVTLQDAMKLFDINDHIFQLLLPEPFYAAISRHVQKTATLTLPTAGVRITPDGYYELLYNPLFFARYDAKRRLGVLKHEFYHLILEHVSTRLPVGGMSKMWNVATDLSINTHIADELPIIGCIPGRGPFADFAPGMSAEFYFAELMKKQQENKKNGKGDKGEGEGDGDGFGDTLDDHSGWGENAEGVDPSVKEIAKQRLEEVLRASAEEANKKSWGTVSQDMRTEIMRRISSKVDWKTVLRYFIKTSQRANKTNTVRRLNKRYPYIHAGSKVDRRANIAISIDQSGSVSDELLTKFFAELNTLAKLASFTVIPFDTEVDEKLVYVWKKGKYQKAVRVKGGGTDFNCCTKYVNEHQFDGHIILTDMYAPKPISSSCQRMWMTNHEGATSPYFSTTERVISID